MKKFSIIAAMDSRRGIGLGGKLPWHLSGDMDYFRKVSVGLGNNAVIMGRTTWQLLPPKFRPLPRRLNVVLSHQSQNLPAGVIQAGSFEEALKLPQVLRADEVFIIGGANVYSQAIEHNDCNKIYLTEVEDEFPCDVYFPLIPDSFAKVSISESITEGGITYRFAVYEKK